MPLRALSLLLACALSMCMPYGPARSAELNVFASRAIWTVLEVVGPEFEKASGPQAQCDYGPEFGICGAHQRWRSIRCDCSAAGSAGWVDQEWESKCRP